MDIATPQIVIPMSGFGERFRRVGYAVPKPLIEVDGKTIIEHVIDMFDGAKDFIFICNNEHLDNPDFRMREIILDAVPAARIVGVKSRSMGPIDAVSNAMEFIDPARPVVVNYCDFTCFWDYADFVEFVSATGCDGAIPAYKGFHPHSLGSTKYAYVRETGDWAYDIQEKQPFTDNSLEEYASSGTYYFASGALLAHAIEGMIAQDLTVGGEYYVSLAYKILFAENKRVAVYPLQHFMQWGTPADLEQYKVWSRTFRDLIDPALTRDGGEHPGALLVPMAGLGQRFADAGYTTPKPIIEVSGRPMVCQAALDAPRYGRSRFIVRNDLPGLAHIESEILAQFPDSDFVRLDGVTDGQARTCYLGLDGLDMQAPLTIIACDNGMIYSAADFDALFNDPSVDVIVWGNRGHPPAEHKPTSYGWIVADDNGVISAVNAKVAPENPRQDPVVIGAFTFRRAADFAAAAAAMFARDGKVNGEFYVDVAINDAIALGLDVRLLSIKDYLCWGTPDEYRTFQYWQSCFDKWKSHPYALEKDSRVDPSAIPALRDQYRYVKPSLPSL